MNFTKGPWKVIERGPCGPAKEAFWIGAGETEWRGPEYVVRSVIGEGTQDNGKANAELIAAAPDMFAALEKILMINGSTGGAEALVKEFKFIAEQAIKKAKG